VAERQLSERKKVTAIVYLCVTGQCFHRCRARDPSVGGVYVAMQPPTLRHGYKVHLVFVLAAGAKIKLPWVQATVVRVSKHGAGLLLQSWLGGYGNQVSRQQTSLERCILAGRILI
jgi:hypothetical protein